MNRKLLHTLEGLRDLHPEDTGRKHIIENRMLSVFRHYGYEQVQTPTFEYYDIYQYERGTKDGKNLFKFFNREGEILALRPDVTPSVARYTATFYNHIEEPKRFSYVGNVFYNNENYQGKLREFTQAGVECIGLGTPEADAEIIAIAINSLLSSGLEEFQIDIGHAGFFKGIMEDAGLEDDLQEQVRIFIDEKNYIAVEELLEDEHIDVAHKKALLEMPQLFGDITLLDKASALTSSETAKQAIRRLGEVYSILEDYGLCQYISFDLGMVNKLQYYTGIIFKGYTYETGDSIVDGGRYDDLIGTFTYETPAVGFAIKTDDLLNALTRQNISVDRPTINTLLVYGKESRTQGIQLAESMRRQGMTIELMQSDDVKDIEAYGKRKEIGGILRLEETGQIRLHNLTTGEEQIVSLDDLLKGGQ